MTSCTDISSALGRLESKIDSIPRVDENSIVNKAVKKSSSIFDPKIASVGVVAAGAAITATQSQSIASIAKELADDALRLAAPLVSKIGALAGQIANLIGRFGGILLTITNIVATIASFAFLQTQINGLQAENQALRQYINAAFNQANAAMSAANQAGSIANSATVKANGATAKANFAIAETKILAETLNRTTQLANSTAAKLNQTDYKVTQVDEKATQAGKKAGEANYKADSALGKATILDNKVSELDKGLRKVYETLDYKIGVVLHYLENAIVRNFEEMDALYTIQSQRIDDVQSSLASTDQRLSNQVNNVRNELPAVRQKLNSTEAIANTALRISSEANSRINSNTTTTNGVSQAELRSVSSAASAANTKSDIALATSVNAANLAQRALTRPTTSVVYTQSTGINRSDAELNKYINTQVNQSTGLRVEQVKVEVQAGQQTLKAEILKAINPSAIQAAGITAQQAKDEQLRQQPILAELQSQIAAIPTNINQVNQAISQKVNTTDLQGYLNSAITQATTVSAQQVEGLKTSTQNIINPIQATVAATVAQVGVLGKQATENLNLNQQGLIGIAGIAAAVQAMPLTLANSPALKASTTAAAKTGTCQASQPGGCGGAGKSGFGGLTDNLAQKADLALQAGQGALLASMNSTLLGMKSVLGTQILAGGISASLGRFMSSSVVDRAVNLVTCAGVIHNCLMLSNSIQESFFEILDNIVAIPQLIKDPNANTIDTKQQFTKTADTFFSSVFGASEYAAIKAQWKSYSTIYNSGAQIFGQARDIFQETQQIQFTTSNWVAELGNGLTEEGVISEDNWDYKDASQEPKGKYFGRLDNIRKGLQTVENVFEDLEQITQSARSIVDSANEIKQNSDIIKTAITTANSAAKADREAKVEGLELPNFNLDNLF